MKKTYFFPKYDAEISDKSSLQKEEIKKICTLTMSYLKITEDVFTELITMKDWSKCNFVEKQIINFVISLINFYTLKDKISFKNLAGYSLGEITSLVAAEVIEIEEGIEIVYKRSKSIENIKNKVGSLSLGIKNMKKKEIENICNETMDLVWISIEKSDNEFSLTGTISAIKTIHKKISAKNLISNEMKKCSGIHTPIMYHAGKYLENIIEKINFKTPKYNIFQNATGEKTIDPLIIKKNLKKQLTSPLLWSKILINSDI